MGTRAGRPLFVRLVPNRQRTAAPASGPRRTRGSNPAPVPTTADAGSPRLLARGERRCAAAGPAGPAGARKPSVGRSRTGARRTGRFVMARQLKQAPYRSGTPSRVSDRVLGTGTQGPGSIAPAAAARMGRLRTLAARAHASQKTTERAVRPARVWATGGVEEEQIAQDYRVNRRLSSSPSASKSSEDGSGTQRPSYMLVASNVLWPAPSLIMMITFLAPLAVIRVNRSVLST